MDPDSLPLLFSSLTFSPASVGDIITLIFAVVFLGFSAFISASEIAFFSLSPQDINELEEEKKPQDTLSSPY